MMVMAMMMMMMNDDDDDELVCSCVCVCAYMCVCVYFCVLQCVGVRVCFCLFMSMAQQGSQARLCKSSQIPHESCEVSICTHDVSSTRSIPMLGNV